LGKILHSGEKTAQLLDMMFNVISLLMKFSEQIDNTMVLLLIPAMIGVELIAEDKSQCVKFFHLAIYM
jgi:hypothetical protein